MGSRLTPMIHVPDVRQTALWYEAIGFSLVAWHGCAAEGLGRGSPPAEIELDWALLRWGDDDLMLNAGGLKSEARRREVDLYIRVEPQGPEGVDALFERLKGRADIVEAPYDAFHGARELIIRDNNGFWITFAEPRKTGQGTSRDGEGLRSDVA